MKNLLKISLKPAVAGLVAVACAACSGTPVQMGSSSAVTTAGETRTISAQACGFQLLLLIPIALNSRAERAYEALTVRANGDPITDVQVQERWIYGFVGTTYCTDLRAKAVHTNVHADHS